MITPARGPSKGNDELIRKMKEDFEKEQLKKKDETQSDPPAKMDYPLGVFEEEPPKDLPKDSD